MLASVTVSADNSARRNLVKSQGVVKFNDSNGNDITIDSMDLYILADEIDTLETSVKTGLSNSLHTVGSTTADSSMQLSSLFNLVEHSQDCSNGAVARNLPTGVDAWVEGVHVVGNNGDIDEAYQRGYVDGRASVANGQISYEYHQHTGSSTTGGGCYATVLHRDWEVVGSHEEIRSGNCNCGYGNYSYGPDPCPNCFHHHWHAVCNHSYETTVTVDDYGWVTKNYYDLTCTKTPGVTIESATIVFP